MSKEKAKGYRGEVKVVDYHEQAGIPCTRVPFSGSHGHLHEDLQHDVNINDSQFKGEVKSRSSDSGFKKIKDWMGDADILFILEDRKEPIVIMSFPVYASIWWTKLNE